MDKNHQKEYFALNKTNMYTKQDIFENKQVSLSKVISEDDIETFMSLSGDNNPIHHDEEFSKKTMFKGRIAHGLLAIGLISSGLTRLMGPGNVWLSHNFEFLKPIRINDQITATLKILEIKKNKTCVIETIVTNQKKDIIVKGIATARIFPISEKNRDK